MSVARASKASRRSPSLATHLDRALAQGATLFLGVVYDLPGRDCAALASNGELPGTAEGLARYKTEYVDAIAAIARQSKYANLRIVFEHRRRPAARSARTSRAPAPISTPS